MEETSDNINGSPVEEVEVEAALITTATTLPQTVEELTIRLKESEEAREKLKQNFVKLKGKLINTSALVNLYNKTKENERQTSQLLNQVTQESANLRVQLEQALKETHPLIEAREALSKQLQFAQKELEVKESHLRSARAYNEQLKAELSSSLTRREDVESLQKELQKTKKELNSSQEYLKQSAKKIEILQTTMKQLESENELTKKMLSDCQQGSESLQTQLSQAMLRMATCESSDEPLAKKQRVVSTKSTSKLNRKPSENNEDYTRRLLTEAHPESQEQIISILEKQTLDIIETTTQRIFSDYQLLSTLQEDLFLDTLCLLYHALNIPFSSLLQFILRTIIKESETVHATYLCRSYFVLCKILGYIQRARVTCFDFIKFKIVNPKIWATVASTWPDVLLSDSLLMNAIKLLLSSDKQILTQLRTLPQFQWEEANDSHLEQYVLSLLSTLQSIKDSTGESTFIVITKSLELVSLFKGWVWTYNSLIVQKLWPHFNPASNTPECTIVFIVKLIGTLGRCALETNSEDISFEGMEQLRRRMMVILDFPEFTLDTKVAAAEALLQMSVTSLAGSAPVVSWFNALPEEIKIRIPNVISENVTALEPQD